MPVTPDIRFNEFTISFVVQLSEFLPMGQRRYDLMQMMNPINGGDSIFIQQFENVCICEFRMRLLNRTCFEAFCKNLFKKY